jgi:radical SAM-linked protein
MKPYLMDKPGTAMQRIRVFYAKTQNLRYTGNLDVHKIWERTFRRAKLPLAYSQGYHPQPKINQACPLPLGMTSRAEIIDFWLDPELPLEETRLALVKCIPPGIELQDIKLVDLCEPALQTQVVAAEFQATWPIPPQEKRNATKILEQKIKEILSFASLLRTWKKKDYDLRPYILQLEVVESADIERICLFCRLTAREGATGRPEELLSALDIDPFAVHIERVGLIFR